MKTSIEEITKILHETCKYHKSLSKVFCETSQSAQTYRYVAEFCRTFQLAILNNDFKEFSDRYSE